MKKISKNMSQLLMTLCAIMMTCCLFTACSDDEETSKDAPLVTGVDEKDFIGVWTISEDGEDVSFIVLESNYSATIYVLDEDNPKYYDDVINGRWIFDASKGVFDIAAGYDSSLSIKLTSFNNNRFSGIAYEDGCDEDYEVTFYRSNMSSLPQKPNSSAIYEGKDFVGSWQGSDGSSRVFFIQLNADGTYVDYFIIDGKKEYKSEGKYTVTGNQITVPSDCNFANNWGSGKPDDPIVMSFSGKNQMTWTTNLMNLYKQKLILNRK